MIVVVTVSVEVCVGPDTVVVRVVLQNGASVLQAIDEGIGGIDIVTVEKVQPSHDV